MDVTEPILMNWPFRLVDSCVYRNPVGQRQTDDSRTHRCVTHYDFVVFAA